MRMLSLLACALLAITAGQPAASRTRVVDGGPTRLVELTLLSDAIAQAKGKPLHIVYVHGMRAERSGASAELRAALARVGFGSSGPGSRTVREAGANWPSQARYIDQPIWTAETWKRSQPFLDRYKLHRGADTIIIDEVNWWPLLFPLKCRFLLKPEGALSGVDKAHLELCGRSDDPYYPWLTPDELSRSLAARPIAGPGALLNGTIKRQIFNWGLADAVIAVGTMREPITDAIEWAFQRIDAEGSGDGRRIVMSESLGSFVVLDALNRNAPHTKSYLEQTSDLYFFANQFALLELARISGIRSNSPNATPFLPGKEDDQSPLATLAQLRLVEANHVRSVLPQPRQIIALTDPSDMLSWPVPCIPGSKVANLLVPMTGGPLKLFADPVRAHRGHLTNRRVWEVLFGRKPVDAPRATTFTCL